MFGFEFLDLLLGNVDTYLASVIPLFVLYFLLLRKQIYSLFDPLFLYTIFSCFAGGAVVFMYLESVIAPAYFHSYALTQSAFFAGLLFFRPINKNEKVAPATPTLYSPGMDERRFLTRLYVVSSTVYVTAALVSYAVGGVPLFYTSRHDFYQSDAGFGVVSRIIYATAGVTTFLLVHRLRTWQERSFPSILYDGFIALNILANSVLTGSKSTFLTVIFTIFFYDLYSRRFDASKVFALRLKTFQIALLFGAVAAALVVTMIQDEDRSTLGLGALAALDRFVLSGDVFILAYPNEVIENLQWHNPLLVLFQDTIGLFRLASWDSLPPTLGIELFQYHVPTADTVGPNARHNVFGFVYFGFYGSIAFSFCAGVLLGFVRNKLYRLLRPTALGGLLYTLLALPLSAVEADLTLALGYLDNLLLVLPPLFLVSHVLSKGMRPSSGQS